MPPLVLACREVDFSPATGECAAPFYTTQSQGLPALSIDDALLIGLAFAYLLGTAFVFSRLRKFIENY